MAVLLSRKGSFLNMEAVDKRGRILGHAQTIGASSVCLQRQVHKERVSEKGENHLHS